MVTGGKICARIKESKRYPPNKATQTAGVSISGMTESPADYGIKSRPEFEDYRRGPENLKKVGQEETV